MRIFKNDAAYVMKLKADPAYKYLVLYHDGRFYSFASVGINENFTPADCECIRESRRQLSRNLFLFLGSPYQSTWSYRLYKGGLL